MPPKQHTDPKDQLYRAYPLPNPVDVNTSPPQPREYHGYDAFIKGQLGLDTNRLGDAMDAISNEFKKEDSFDGLFVATDSMKKMAPICGKLWALNCFKDESRSQSDHYFYCCVGVTANYEKSVLALAIMGAETTKNWTYFLSNLQKAHASLQEPSSGITFISDGASSELSKALAQVMTPHRRVVCSKHSPRGCDQEYLESDFCEASCYDQIDTKSRPLVIQVYRTTERQRDVAIRCNVDDGENRVTENQFRMSMEVINENLNRRGVKPHPPSWAQK